MTYRLPLETEPADGQLVRHEPIPRIVLLNFSDKTTQKLKVSGHNVHLCQLEQDNSRNCYNVKSPKPPQEIDVLIVRDAGYQYRRHDQALMTMTSSGGITWPSGKYDGFQSFCGSILSRGRLCIFYVSEIAGSFLAHAGIGITANPAYKLWPKKTAHYYPPNDGEAGGIIRDFLKRWFEVPPVYIGLTIAAPQNAICVGLQDEASASYVISKAVETGSDKSPGIVMVLPDYGDRDEILDSLLRDVLARLRPNLFPEIIDTSWKYEPEFTNPHVEILENKKVVIEKELQTRLLEIDSEIHEIKENEQFLESLLTEDGETLKKAVILALQKLVHISDVPEITILDVDSDSALRNGCTKREDLRVEWNGKAFLINVTGRAQSLKLSSINQMDEHQRLFIKHNPSKATSVHSVLIANFGHKDGCDPRKRGPMFGSTTNDASERLLAAGHGAWSTYDLYMIIRMSQRGQIPVNAALLAKLLSAEGILTIDALISE